jgi:DNA mismatch repair protein MutS2
VRGTLEELGWNRLLGRIAELAESRAARGDLQDLAPASDPESSARLRDETLAAASLLERGLRPSLDWVDPMEQILQALAEGAVSLDASHLRAAGLGLGALSDLREGIGDALEAGGEEGPPPQLSRLGREWLARCPDLSGESGRLLRSTTPEGGLSPRASPELSRLLREVETGKRRISERIERLAGRLSSRGLLRDAPPTIRNGRYVLPVRSGSRGRVKGIVHDRSDTGETVFVEPMELAEAGNRLQEAQLDLEAERRRVLRELTGLLRDRREDLATATETARELDAVFARARYHLEAATVFPARGSRVRLLQLRHPMIPPGESVDNDLELPEDWKALVISGPNAGGKSVLLKAFGLAVLCAQSGLGATAAPGSTLPFFGSVRASIGDQQSIEEHLSTYSARLSQQMAMMRSLGRGSLVLIDEPAAGTDPVTGSAMSAALLENLTDSGCRVVLTTHMGQLKNLASGREGFHNGCMTFDEETLEPQYRFVLGVPGSSFTLEIAQRMGYPEEVLDRARELAGDSFRLDRLMAELTSMRDRREEELRKLAGEREEARRAREEASTERSRGRAEISALRRHYRQRWEGRLDELGSRADSLLGRLASTEDRQERRRIRAEIRELESTEAPEGPPPGGPRAQPERGAAAVRKGSWVTVSGWRGKGVVDSLRDDTAVVSFGNLRLEKPLEDLTPAEPPEGGGAPQASWDMPPESPEINLIGMRAAEARAALEEKLEGCVATGVGVLRIIHGKGRGVLMSVVTELLRGDSRVSSWRQGRPAEGGVGVTVARLGGEGAE